MTRKLEGKEVKNSMRVMRLDITDEDIRKGKPLDPCGCAAAQAIKRMTGAEHVRVHRGVTYIQKTEDGPFTRYMTSSALRLETIIFDRGGTFIPGEYDLAPVPLSMLAPKKPKRSKSKGMKPREAKLARRRLTIPGVRKTARVTEPEDE